MTCIWPGGNKNANAIIANIESRDNQLREFPENKTNDKTLIENKVFRTKKYGIEKLRYNEHVIIKKHDTEA